MQGCHTSIKRHKELASLVQLNASGDLCIIRYFSVAHARGWMLYLPPVSDQCPQGPPFREFFPPQMLQTKG